MCNIYTDFKSIIDSAAAEKFFKIYIAHIKNKAEVAKTKIQDLNNCKTATNKEKICVAVFDYQKILQTPQAEKSILFYKRKFNVANFTVFDIGSRKHTVTAMMNR